MGHWVRRLRWIIAVAGLAFGVVVVFGIRQRPPRPVPVPVATLDPRADVEINEPRSLVWSGVSDEFQIEAASQLVFANGDLTFQGVKVSALDPSGDRAFVATGLRGMMRQQRDLFTVEGDVRLESTDGLTVEANEVSFSRGEGIARTPGPSVFNDGTLTGRSVGMSYDRRTAVLVLESGANVTLVGDGTEDARIDITSQSAGLARQDHYLRFERDVVIRTGAREIRSDNAVAQLSADAARLASLDLRGHAVIAISGAVAGAVRELEASDITVTYADDGRRINRALMAGGAVLRMAGERARAGLMIAADVLDIQPHAEGGLSSLHAQGGVRLELPAGGDAPARRVRAASLVSLDGDNGTVSALRLTDNVVYEEFVGKPPVPRVVRANTLDLGFAAGMTTVTSARFSGAVSVDEGDLHATAGVAAYDVARGVIDFDPGGGAAPTLSLADIRVEASDLVLTLQGPTVVARGAVSSELRPGARGRTGTPPTGRRLPALLDADRPVTVRSETLEYDGARSQAVYQGGARLWQGESVVRGDRIAVDGVSGNLTAEGQVQSTFLLEEMDALTRAVKPALMQVGGQSLSYDEQAHRLTYTTGASLKGPQGDLKAGRIELYLAEQGQQIDRLEGYDSVTLREAGRTTTGSRLTYISLDGRYTMTGNPVKIVEACRESEGRSVTLFRTADRLVIDGQQAQRTRTKSGSGCPEPGR